MKIIEDNPKYIGNYVALENHESTEPICYGKNIDKVDSEAKKLGFEHPILRYISDTNMTQLYSKELEIERKCDCRQCICGKK